jgi:hypothetical protein
MSAEEVMYDEVEISGWPALGRSDDGGFSGKAKETSRTPKAPSRARK